LDPKVETVGTAGELNGLFCLRKNRLNNLFSVNMRCNVHFEVCGGIVLTKKNRDRNMSIIGLLLGIVVLILGATNSTVSNILGRLFEALLDAMVIVYNFFLRLFGVY